MKRLEDVNVLSECEQHMVILNGTFLAYREENGGILQSRYSGWRGPQATA